ncbi:MAG: hypothetical protein R2911_31260 [Caldilineaceae bacterium]
MWKGKPEKGRRGEGEKGERGNAPAPCPLSPCPLPLLGVIVQYGGQTPLNLADSLQKAGVPILGTLPDAIEMAEDRDRFEELLIRLDIPARRTARRTADQAVAVAQQVGYPVVVRPSYVLGGRMAIVDDEPCAATWPKRSTWRRVPMARPIAPF